MSWIIRAVEHSDGSHVLLYWLRSKSGKKVAYQATGHGVNFCGTPMLEAHHEIMHITKFQISDEAFDSCMDYCIDNSDKPYSCMHIIGLGLVRLFSLFHIKISNPFRDGETSQVCVETYLRALIAAGINTGLDPELTGIKEVEMDIINRGQVA